MYAVPSIGYTLLDRYYIEEIIDGLGDTAILKCMDTRLDVYGAVKFLLLDDTEPDWEKRREQFISSFKAIARLNHPNIVHVSNIETRGGLTFSVMELLHGMNLEQFISGGSGFELKEAVEVFWGIIDAVSMAHSNDILHKRISPSQIVLNHQGSRLTPRVINFLSYKNARDLDPLKALPYLAPEQFEDFDKATAASDIFGICATIYAVFAHEPPLRLSSYDEYVMFYEQCSGIDWFPDSIPAEFVPILQAGLRTNPEDRLFTASSLLQEVKKIGSNYKISANLSLDANKNRDFTGSQPAMPSVTPSGPLMLDASGRMSNASGQPLGSIYTNDMRASVSGSQPRVRPVTASQTGVHHVTKSHPIVCQSQSQPAVRQVTHTLSQPAIHPVLTPSHPITVGTSGSNPAVPAPNKSGVYRTSGVSQELIAPDESINGILLSNELRKIYKLRRVDYSFDHAFIGAVSTRNNLDDLYCIKCFYANSDVEKAVFNEGVRRNDLLAHECPYIESILQTYPESCAFLMSDIQRQPLPICIEQNGVFTNDVVAQIGILLAQAMEIAHQHGFINGNIKPSNIIFEDRSGVVTPVLYDFGQSLYIDSLVALRIHDVPYIAPELNYNLQEANAQADIYAFGMCLIYMLIGRVPYNSTGYDIAHEIEMLHGMQDIRQWRNDISPDLLQIISWCTSYNPRDRYVHFSDIVRDLSVVYQKLTSINS